MTEVGYSPYGLRMKILQRHRWIDYDIVMAWVRRYSLLAFHDAENRSRMRADYLALQSGTPFGPVKRFPANDIWVDVEHMKFGGIVRRIMAAADVPSSFMEKEMPSSSGRIGQAQQLSFTAAPEGITNLSDAKRSWDKGFEELTTLLRDANETAWFKSGIYNREMFERAHGLTWRGSKGDMRIDVESRDHMQSD